MKKNKLLTTLASFHEGPLLAAEKRLEDFSYNLYFSYVFHESVITHQKLQDEYIDAFLEEDTIRMHKLDMEIALVEGAFEATANMIDATGDIPS
tara:strand:- start:1262 stop:1543 length:282 start_codon:yes stop_codon:yes gene_type:complete